MHQRDLPPSPERRRFLAVARRYGVTTALVAGSGGFLWNDDALAQTAAEEEAKQKAAKHTMIFATEYKIEDYVKYPVMQAAFKSNVESLTKNQIYVKLHPAGQLGIGTALAQKIQGGTVQGGALSLSNFSPFTKAVDLINIPYWCGENQKFANLVTSAAWNNEITPKVIDKGYRPIFYFTVDPRTVATRRGFGKVIKTPADMKGVKMRVPSSKLLQKFYRLAGANPTVVAWGETPTAIKQGVADALDPSLGALATFGFQDLLETVTFVRSVSDAQMFAANSAWFGTLSKDLQVAFDDASRKTQIESFAQIAPARTESMRIMTASGTKFYNPTAAEFKLWDEACGESRKEWDEDKIELAGSIANFEKLKMAANTKGPITVGDYQG
ncbi:MAG: TRAP transporter substrate-binding protein [Betaproteobacteria bacterium]|nr:TRAP transporter substrate-binding protein [Betaproteobacteria bacterium]